MADAQLELPCQLDAESVRALALALTAIHSPRLGRTIRASVVSPRVLAKRHRGRAAAAVQWREPTHESGLFENFVEEAHALAHRVRVFARERENVGQ